MTFEYHLTEDRDDLEYRFRFMGALFIKARKLTVMCCVEDCPSCAALRSPIPLPDAMLQKGQEPREDLEEAVVSINDRFETLVELAANGCPGRNFIVGLLQDATERLGDDA